MDMRKIVIGLLLTISVLLLVIAAAVMDTHSRVARLEKRIDHLDEEVDEAATNVKRMMVRTPASDTPQQITPSKARAEAVAVEYDFGAITKQNGKVRTDFVIKNTGRDALIIGDIVTSCGCTSATISEKNIAPGGSATLTATFDPNFHEEPQGRFSRSIFVPTNDPNALELEFTISMKIIN